MKGLYHLKRNSLKTNPLIFTPLFLLWLYHLSIFQNITSNYRLQGKIINMLAPEGHCNLGNWTTSQERKRVNARTEGAPYCHGIQNTCCALERRKSEWSNRKEWSKRPWKSLLFSCCQAKVYKKLPGIVSNQAICLWLFFCLH
jgi:hypothetical protein